MLGLAKRDPGWPLLLSTSSQQYLPMSSLEQGKRAVGLFSISPDVAALYFHVWSCAEGSLDPFSFWRDLFLLTCWWEGMSLAGWGCLQGWGVAALGTQWA